MMQSQPINFAVNFKLNDVGISGSSYTFGNLQMQSGKWLTVKDVDNSQVGRFNFMEFLWAWRVVQWGWRFVIEVIGGL